MEKFAAFFLLSLFKANIAIAVPKVGSTRVLAYWTQWF